MERLLLREELCFLTLKYFTMDLIIFSLSMTLTAVYFAVKYFSEKERCRKLEAELEDVGLKRDKKTGRFVSAD